MQASTTHSPPPAATRTNAQLNLSVLQRHDPSIIHVLSIAPYTVIYTFSTEAQTWEKAGIEGTLFVVQHSTTPTATPNARERYSVFVLNRLGLDNFELELHKAEDVEITDDYIILQDEDRGVIYGLWVFAEPPPSSTAEMRSVNAKVIQDCAARAEASSNNGLASEQPQPQQQQWSTMPQPASATIAQNDASAQNMARQLSLRELFAGGQPQYAPQGTNAGQGYSNQYQYPSLQHTSFAEQQQPRQYQHPAQQEQGYYDHASAFRFPPQQSSQYEQHQQLPQQPASSLPQRDVLGDLFQRARQGYSYT